jgi:hypothetical protein
VQSVVVSRAFDLSGQAVRQISACTKAGRSVAVCTQRRSGVRNALAFRRSSWVE